MDNCLTFPLNWRQLFFNTNSNIVKTVAKDFFFLRSCASVMALKPYLWGIVRCKPTASAVTRIVELLDIFLRLLTVLVKLLESLI